ncbi:hypothetical protein [Salinispora tropica]|uniref:Uncharacterized protein n=1 Tax=Salinispora tropica (strain ATCC BAA-916 / DSM 44818 / JCM 13857 / NBRC 105044 / CNB-440) TaxID=369723 RepID=A4X2D5_SALTO|nr:hypothetical protein [Salinispora tropica]ABP53035.1 hypothetical protein Strop_0553 [Salinispora tropica CNB-440]
MIEIEQARELLAKAVETQGWDFVYNPGGNGPCKYEPISVHEAGGNPDDPRTKTGCLIGVVLGMVDENRHRGLSNTIDALGEGALRGLMSHETTRYFRVAQHAQDAGRTWGAAYDAAEAHYRAHYAR